MSIADEATIRILKAMGLSNVIDAAKEFAERGTMQKIITFADGVETLNARIESLEQSNRELCDIIRELRATTVAHSGPRTRGNGGEHKPKGNVRELANGS